MDCTRSSITRKRNGLEPGGECRADGLPGRVAARFADQRSLPAYRALRQAAQAYGDWAAERESALARLRAGAPSVLIDALIEDGDIEAAWKEAPEIATDAQMLRLADASIGARPADALAVYLKAIAPLYDQIGDPAYLRMAPRQRSQRPPWRSSGWLLGW